MKFDTNIRMLAMIYELPEYDRNKFNEQLAKEMEGAEFKKINSEWGIFSNSKKLSEEEINIQINELLAKMTLEQKVRQMTPNLTPRENIWFYNRYNSDVYVAGEDHELNIPGIRFTDGPAGIIVGYESTAFPSAIARGASFDIELEKRIGDAIGIEGRSIGANFFGGVCINLLRHPAWGRAQETFGEDPCLLGKMGVALIEGVQNHMMACVKHFAANSIENARFKVNVKIEERVLHEVYLPHFKRCIDAGVASVMSAYNRVNGEWCGHNKQLLRDILKEKWKFKGFVISDFIWGTRDTEDAINGGLDIEMHIEQFYGKYLVTAVKNGFVDENLINDAASRILKQKIKFASIGNNALYTKEKMACKDHTLLAREAAEKSIVLLKNDNNVLPLNNKTIKRIAIVGKLALQSNLGDVKGASAVFPPYCISAFEGIKNYCDKYAIDTIHVSGECLPEIHYRSKNADIIVVVVGLTCADEGEYVFVDGDVGGDRKNLRLHNEDIAIINAASKTGKNVVVCLQGGSAIQTENWANNINSILMTWYPGMEGGNALARVLFGEVNPSAKMPMTVPKTRQQLPYFNIDTKEIIYDFYHGYFLVDKNNYDVAYHFGYGLSYTTFSFSNISAKCKDDTFIATIDVENTGCRDGAEVVQLYVGYCNSKVDRHVKDLKDFQKVNLKTGQKLTVEFKIPISDLSYYNVSNHEFELETGCEYIIYLGNSSRKQDLLSINLTI